MLAALLLSGCVSQQLEKPEFIQGSVPKTIESSQPLVVEPPLQIATWSPTKYNGRFTAMGLGYLTKFNNCLTLTMDTKGLPTKDNTLLLVLADTSFSWDAAKEMLLFEGKPYTIGDELYLGGAAFVYPNPNITDQVKVNWIDCGLNKGWLGG
jgi:hypothetical protein